MTYSYDRKQAAASPEAMATEMGRIVQSMREIFRSTQTLVRQADSAEELRALYPIAAHGNSTTTLGFYHLKDEIEAKIKSLEAKAMSQGQKFDLSAEDLDLYSDKPGAKRAAKAISTALTKAAKDVLRGLGKIKDTYEDDRDHGKANSIISAAFHKHVEPALSKYSDVGASDSEPHYVTRNRLVSLAKGFLGADRWSRIEI